MWTILAVFAGSFVFVAILVVAILWAMHIRAELDSWKRKHREIVEAENTAAWRANQRMIMY